MLKAVVQGKAKDGRSVQLIVLGLSELNLLRLREGRPIDIDGTDISLPGVRIVIFAGETEQSMARDLDELVGPETMTQIDPRLRD